MKKSDLKAFAEAYLETFNAGKAYAVTHPGAKQKSCWTGGSRLLRNVEVQEYIAERLKEMTMDADEILARLSMQARGDLSPFLRFDGEQLFIDLSSDEAKRFMYLVKSVRMNNRVLRTTIGAPSAGTAKDGGKVQKKQQLTLVKEELVQQWVSIELHDVQTALTLLGKHLKLFTEKIEFDGSLTIDGYEAMMSRVYGAEKK